MKQLFNDFRKVEMDRFYWNNDLKFKNRLFLIIKKSFDVSKFFGYSALGIII